MGYGKTYIIYKPSGNCGDCGQLIKAQQEVRRKYDEDKSYVLCHADCEKAKEPLPLTYGKVFCPDHNKGFCTSCGLMIRAGQNARYCYDNNKNTRTLVHENCEGAKKAQESLEKEFPYRLGGGSGYGCRGWEVGEVVPGTRPEHPEFLYVAKTGSSYYAEDGMSFGVGDENGHVYWARCREATPEEATPLKETRKKEERIKEIRVRLNEIKNEIKKGTRPDGTFTPEGDRLFDTQDIYGGGDWFVVGDQIWYVMNNGADGDNWSYNNIRTGGAGAIGWYLDNKDLGEEIRKLKEEMDALDPRH